MSVLTGYADVVRDVVSRRRVVAAGSVAGVRGLALRVVGLRAPLGDLCTVTTAGGPLDGEVVGLDGDGLVLMPLGAHQGVAVGDRVEHRGEPLRVHTGAALLGRVLDALGRPIDGGPPLVGPLRRVSATAPPALSRRDVSERLHTGVSAIDGFLTLGRGQRVGIFAGSGVGKSTLLGSIATHCDADVNVIALIGERGREAQEFVRDTLGERGMTRSVVVVSTSDSPAMQRVKGALCAVTLAEAFRAEGRNVMFVMDSATRFAGAVREVGLAAGEPPTLRGYPPSLFSWLPTLVERLGNDAHGTITALLTVLVEGDDMNEPVADALRGYLDGHVVLSRDIAARGRFPAIDVLASVSRLMTRVVPAGEVRASHAVRRLLAHWQEQRDLVSVGAYRRGNDPLLDEAMAKMPRIEELLFQGTSVRPGQVTSRLLAELAGGHTLLGGDA